jgi:hypothetical protein
MALGAAALTALCVPVSAGAALGWPWWSGPAGLALGLSAYRAALWVLEPWKDESPGPP